MTIFEKCMNKTFEERDEQWELDFLKAFPEQKFTIQDTEPKEGPDGWPYLLVQDGGDEPAHQVIKWLTEQGVGLVLNAHKKYPDYVFSYGMLWNFRERGEFLSEGYDLESGDVVLTSGQKIWVGEPSLDYVPEYVRDILRQFFKDQGIERLQWAVISTDQKNYDLAISLESLGDPDESEHQGIGEAISWFLPAHFSIALIHQKGLPDFYTL